MRPILGSLGANTLVILTAEEMRLVREALGNDGLSPAERIRAAYAAFNAGIARGTAHLEAEFKGLQEEKKRGK